MLDFGNVLDGVWIGLGAGMVWVGGVLAASLARSFGVAGGSGFRVLTRFAISWWKYSQADARDVVNVTLYTTRGGVLSTDTIMGDKLLADVWTNDYHVRRILASTKHCTMNSPIVFFKDSNKYNIDTYGVVYDKLVSMVAERCTNEESIDLALGRDMVEHRFVLALTYEPERNGRLRHPRVMMIMEDEMASLLDDDYVSRVRLRRPHHSTRLDTMRAIAREWSERQDRLGHGFVWRPKREK